jgi:hypothetical protein
MIAIKACVIHEVLKEIKSEQNSGVTSLDLSEKLLEPDNTFVEQLLTSFSNVPSSILYAGVCLKSMVLKKKL